MVWAATSVGQFAVSVDMTISLNAAAQVYRQASRDAFIKQALFNQTEAALLMFTGVAAAILPIFSSAPVAIGWLLVANSVLRGVGLLRARHAPHNGIRLISVVIGLLLGALLLRHSGEGLTLLHLLLVVFLTVEGVANINFAMVIRPLANWAWILGSGLLSVLLAGILYSMMSSAGPWAVGLILGLHLVCDGLSLGYVSMKLRDAEEIRP